jgi:hypothetical protein
LRGSSRHSPAQSFQRFKGTTASREQKKYFQKKSSSFKVFVERKIYFSKKESSKILQKKKKNIFDILNLFVGFWFIFSSIE